MGFLQRGLKGLKPGGVEIQRPGKLRTDKQERVQPWGRNHVSHVLRDQAKGKRLSLAASQFKAQRLFAGRADTGRVRGRPLTAFEHPVRLCRGAEDKNGAYGHDQTPESVALHT